MFYNSRKMLLWFSSRNLVKIYGSNTDNLYLAVIKNPRVSTRYKSTTFKFLDEERSEPHSKLFNANVHKKQNVNVYYNNEPCSEIRLPKETKSDNAKWIFLEHEGPLFAPPYEKLPESVRFFYDGKELPLSKQSEEVAGFYAKMLDHEYTSKEVFNKNFFEDWRKIMTGQERAKITDLNKCNFREMHVYFMNLAERNRNRTKEEKMVLKETNNINLNKYGFCTMDGRREKIGNYKIEPPGLFRGRGEHPKMGMLKKRIEAEDVIINCSKDSKIPEPPLGHKWKEVRHDSAVTWLASWIENVQNQVKYITLNPCSKLKGEKDWLKYESARHLHKSIEKIRSEYKKNWQSQDMRIRQCAVALYFIDKLALRAGKEKDEDHADTVGCCLLRVEHIQLKKQTDGKDYAVVFDFLGKDCVRYYNEVPVEQLVFDNLRLFLKNKSPDNKLFDQLTTTILNRYLNELMDGLTAKVFRTYNASFILQQQLDTLTNTDDPLPQKILSYNRANRAVAILCNHQRTVPKNHEKTMERLKEKIDAKWKSIKEFGVFHFFEKYAGRQVNSQLHEKQNKNKIKNFCIRVIPPSNSNSEICRVNDQRQHGGWHTSLLISESLDAPLFYCNNVSVRLWEVLYSFLLISFHYFRSIFIKIS